MNRRALLTSVATALTATAGCSGRNDADQIDSGSDPSPDVVDEDDLPDTVANTLPLMENFTKAIKEYYPESSVTVNRDGELYFEYETEQSTVSELKTEIHQIADIYVDSVGDYEAETLTILTQDVKAIIPYNTAQKRADGGLDQEAFHETIGFLSRDNGNSN